MRWNRMIVATTAFLFVLASLGMAAQEGGKGEVRVGGRMATGTVAAVTAATRMLVVESTLGGQP